MGTPVRPSIGPSATLMAGSGQAGPAGCAAPFGVSLSNHELSAWATQCSRKLVAIVGPTAVGKTALAVELVRRLDGEIIGADSRQVYRYMDIGTAKPTAEERTAAPHHLIDVVDPDEPFGLEQWLELAHGALEDVWSRGKQPLLVGGSGQYVWALLEGWRVPRVPPRSELRRELEAQPPAALVEQLRRVDPEAGRFIDPRNIRRVVRALEVCRVTGKPFSYWRAKAPPPFETLIIGLGLPRQELYRRIDERVEAMVRAGLADEVRRLLTMGYARGLPSMSATGYKEICQYLAGEVDLATAVTRIKMATHRVARHQNAWFKQSDPRIHWSEVGEEVLAEAGWLASQFLGVKAA